MPQAIRFHQPGGPEVLTLESVAVPDPGVGEVRVRQEAIGLNYIDVYFRTGLYPTSLPSGLGLEGAGVVEAVGAGVDALKPGDRVAYCSRPIGAYATVRNVPAAILAKVPDGVTSEVAAAIMLKGLTAEYLLRRTYPVKPGDTILFHAAAGGVGLLACQWARYIGATVIGTVSTDAKAELARAHGAQHVIVYSREDVVAQVKEITGGKGCQVVYDSVGKDTYMKSLDCLAPRGLLALFGAASGPVPAFDLGLLAAKGSLYVTRPTLFTYIAERAEYDAACAALFDVVQRGIVKVNIDQRFALADAAEAHRALESRRTTGATVLLP
jgi:NADPH2:quinone reductase